MSFYPNNTVRPFLCYEYSYTIGFASFPIKNSLYLLPIAPKSLQSLLHLVSCTHRTSIRLSASASTNSPNRPVSESTFQVPTRKAQPSRSSSPRKGRHKQHKAVLRSGWVSPPPVFRRHVGRPRGPAHHSYNTPSLFVLDFFGARGG